MLSKYRLKISEIQLDLPSADAPPAAAEPPAPAPEPPPPPQKKIYFEEPQRPPDPLIEQPRFVPLEPPPPARPPEAEAPLPQLMPQELRPIEAPAAAQPRPMAPKAPAKIAPAARVVAVPSRARLAVILLCVALVAPLVWRRSHNAGDSTHVAFPLPPGHKTGLVVNGGTLVTVDGPSQSLTAVAPDDGRIVSQQKFPNPSLSGLAWGHGSYWSSDTETGFIFRHRPEPPFGLLQGTALPGHAVSVLFDDGRDLWVGDARSDSVYRYEIAGAELKPRAQYSLPGVAVGGLYYSAQTLWVLDSLTRKIRRYRVDEQLAPQDTLDLGHWLSLDSEASAFAVDPSFLWLVSENPAALHRFDLKRVTWSSASSASLPQ